jgi:hypothetical protein
MTAIIIPTKEDIQNLSGGAEKATSESPPFFRFPGVVTMTGLRTSSVISIPEDKALDLKLLGENGFGSLVSLHRDIKAEDRKPGEIFMLTSGREPNMNFGLWIVGRVPGNRIIVEGKEVDRMHFALICNNTDVFTHEQAVTLAQGFMTRTAWDELDPEVKKTYARKANPKIWVW